MNGRSSRPTRAQPTFVRWLRHNPSGIPRRHAVRVVLAGGLLGLLGGVIASMLAGTWSTMPRWALGLGICSGVVGGATIGALGVVVLARLVDRWLWSSDPSLGYADLMRLLLHAGELSFLGAVAGGSGGGVSGLLAGLGWGALVGSSTGALLYAVRGLGLGLGATIGALAGAVGGAIGGLLGRLSA